MILFRRKLPRNETPRAILVGWIDSPEQGKGVFCGGVVGEMVMMMMDVMSMHNKWKLQDSIGAR